MKINIKGIKVFKSLIFYDSRGSFKEVYKKKLLPNKKLFKQTFLGLFLRQSWELFVDICELAFCGLNIKIRNL